MTSLLHPVWAVLSWLVPHSSGLYCIVLHLYSCYQTFISLSSYAGYYWQWVHCTMHQTYTRKFLLAMILGNGGGGGFGGGGVGFGGVFFDLTIRLQHTWFVPVALHGLRTQSAEGQSCFLKQKSGVTPQYSSLRLVWLRMRSGVSYKHLIHPKISAV